MAVWRFMRRRPHKDQDHKVREFRASERSSELLRPSVRSLVLAEKFGQIVRRKWRDRPDLPDVRHVERKLIPRLALLGLRSQAQKVAMRVPRLSYQVSDVLERLREPVPGVKSVCQRRLDRRQVLFRLGVAGRGRRRSPGSGGHYRRSMESQVTCQEIRR